ncbi:MAG: alpha-galactosidase, partial [Acutalibacteraceae bacterium]
LIDFIPKAKYIGAELYVIDDGWMKGRTDDKHGLGDWVIDPVRFPRGLGYIADKVHEAGLMFGLWVEPEMVNPDSDLYRAHPDWVLSEPNRDRTLSRTQCVLDMSRDDITDWAIDWLDKLIIDAKLDYLKWDMNREQTEIGPDSLERGVAVKYMKNIERIWKHLNERFPDLLLENCASGGGRADYGMLPYADRVNRSDNADPIDVMLLHEGYSTLFVPKLAGGAGNVSPSPNHVNKRSAPLDFRVNSGMTGSMSVGVNLLKCDDDELDRLRDAVDRFKTLRPGLQDAYVYRIASAHEHPYSVLQYVKRDKSEFTLFAFGHGMRQWDKQSLRFRMRGLAPDKLYVSESGVTVSGAALMNGGITLGMYGDYYSHVETWKAMN